MKPSKQNYQLKLIDHIYNELPAFTDIFTEESFYMTVFAIIVSTIVAVAILSRFITIKPVE